MNVIKCLHYFLLTFLLSSCVFKADEVKLKGLDLAKVRGGSSTPNNPNEDPIEVEISSVVLENDQLKVAGSYLDSVTQVKLGDDVLSISSQSFGELILTSSSAINIALNSVIDLVFTNAYGQAVTSVQFNLVDGAVTTVKLADDAVTTIKILDGAVTADKLSDMGAGIGQVLKYNGTTWIPGDLSALTYAGNWDASGNSPDLTLGGSLGEFYIVSVAGVTDLSGGAGTNSWSVGDWAVWNNVSSQWEKIDNATNVLSFNGRSGAVSPMANDYTWAQIDKTSSAIGDIADVDLSTPATTGQVLKFDGTNWIASDDLSSGGAGSVSSSEIADGAIVNADISAAAAIDQSKVNGLTTLASNVATNTSDIATNTSAITSNDTDITNNASNISSNASNISANSTAIGTKANSAITLTAGNALSGGGDLSANRTFDVNVDGTSIEIVGDALQVKDVADTKLTTSCSDGEVLSASSGRYVCAASTTIGNWTLNTTDLYYNLGNVGVGTSAPVRDLHVADTTGGAHIMFTNDNSGGTVSDGFLIGLSANGSESVISNYEGGGITFLTSSDGSNPPTTKMFIGPTGNIGMGTTTPATTLHVNGDITATNFIGDGSSLTNVSAITTSQVAASAGSAATPSISFGSDTNTGFYSASADTIEVSVGGTNIFDMSSSGIVSSVSGGGSVSSANGTASAPTFSFAGDTDTGWFRPADNELAASLGGTERVRIDSTGSVGIGTTAPGAKLEVVGGIRSNGLNPSIQFYDSDGTTGGRGVWMGTEGSESFVIQGRNDDFSSGGGDRFVMNRNVGTNGFASLELWNGTSAFAHFNFDNSRVGFGTASPEGSFHVWSNEANYFDRFGGGAHVLLRSSLGTKAAPTLLTNTSTIGTLTFTGYDGTSWLSDGARIKAVATEDWTSTAHGSKLIFSTNASGSSVSNERMTISDIGKVGIGTTNPTETLTVVGDISFPYDFRLQGPSTSDLRNILENKWNSSRGSDELTIAPSGNSRSSIIFGNNPSAATDVLTERMIIDYNGNVGIGTMAPATKLSVVGDVTFTDSDYTQLKFFNTADVIDPTDYWMMEHHQNGQLKFLRRDTSAGTWGNNLVLTEDGNMGVRNTSPIAPLTLGTEGGGTTEFHIMGSQPTGGREGGDMKIYMADDYDSTYNYWRVDVYDDNFRIGPEGFTSLQITPNHNVGIGVSAPAANLHVKTMGADYGSLMLGNNIAGGNHHITHEANGTFSIFDGAFGSGTSRFAITAAGNVGIGTTAPGYKLHVNGSVAGVGAYNATSDRRLKKNFVALDSDGESALHKVLSLNGYYFDWRYDEYPEYEFSEGRDLGVIAQEVEEIFPEAVSENSEGFKSVAYSKLIAPLIEAVKDLFQKGEADKRELERKISSLEERLEKADEKNKALESYICEKDPQASFCEGK